MEKQLNPFVQKQDDTSLLLQLLKEDRERNLERIQYQRKRLVELTAKLNELTAQNECEALREHVREMEENAKKLAKTIEAHEQTIREREATISQRDCQIAALQKKVQEASSEDTLKLNDIIDRQVQQIADMSSEMEIDAKEISNLKKSVKGLQAQLNTKNLMVEYARANGVTFLRNDKMKEFINNAAAKAEEKPLAQIFGEMEADIKKVGIHIPDAPDPDEEFAVGLNDADIIAMDKQPCPYNVEQAQNKPAIVGGRYCRKKCAFNDGIDDDQNVVHCSKKH